jgi:hypothetical protein
MKKLAPNTRDETTYGNEASAIRKAERCGLPHIDKYGAEETSFGWVGVVYLRPDQMWMSRHVVDAGCRVKRLS